MTLRQQAVITALRELETKAKAKLKTLDDTKPDYLYWCGQRDAISDCIRAATTAKEPTRRDPLTIPLIELGYIDH